METALQLSGAAATARPDAGRPTVLVVDPSPEGRRIVRLSLALAGYTIREAVDAADALRLLQTLTPDAIVTGVSMPGPCNGLGLCDIVRGPPGRRDCPVVVLSGRTDPDRLRRIDEAGASALVVQPFSPAALVDAVNGVVGQAKAAFASMRGQPHGALSPMTSRAIPE